MSTALSGRLPLRLFSIYRRQEVHYKTFLTEYSDLLFSLNQDSAPFIIAGDYNLHISDSTDPIVQQFSDLLDEFGVFTVSSYEPTHVSGNVLDFVVCDFNAFAILCNPKVDSDQTCSDHFPVSFDVELVCNSRPLIAPLPRRQLSCIDYDAFNHDLSVSLQALHDDGDVPFLQLLHTYNDILSDTLDAHAPLKQSKIKRSVHPKWFDNELAKARASKRTLEKKYRISRCPSVKAALNLSTIAFNTLADSKRASYFRKAIADRAGDQRALFSLVSELTDSSPSAITPTYAPDEIVANDLNTFFVDKPAKIQSFIAKNRAKPFPTATNSNTLSNKIVNCPNSGIITPTAPSSIIAPAATNSNTLSNKIVNCSNSGAITPNSPSNKTPNNLTLNTSNNITPNNLPSGGPTILREFSPCSQPELAKIISESNLGTSDLDPLPSAVVKKCTTTLLPHLTVLINCSLRQGSVDGMTDAVIRPLLKKAGLDPDLFLSYRPIANLSLLSKLTERVVNSRLNSHMAANNLESSSQYGYKKHHGTETLLIHIMDEIMVAVDSKLGVVVLLIDLSAAFDTVNHSVLLNILYREIGIQGTALKWFKSFLLNRTQRVKVGASLSDPLVLSFGVPQGSVLGPVLFNIYTRSIYHVFTAFGFAHHGYADDNAGSSSFSSVFQYKILIESLPDLLSKIRSWMDDHFLKLNETKTEIIVFGSNHFLSSELTLNGTFTNSGECIRFNDTVKYLGVYLNNSLTLTYHINTITSSSYVFIRKLRSIRSYLSQKDMETLVHAFISSRLDMCNCLFFGLPKSSTLKLQRIQNAAVRVIFSLRKRDSVREHLKSLHWLNVEQRVTFKALLTTFKCLNDMAPAPLTALLSIKDYTSLLLEVKNFFPSSELGRRAFRYYAPRLWNCVPPAIRVLDNIDTFKAKLKQFLFTSHGELMQRYNCYLS